MAARGYKEECGDKEGTLGGHGDMSDRTLRV